MEKEEIIRNLKFYRSDLAGRVGSLCVAGVFLVLPFLSIRQVKAQNTTITYPKEKTVYNQEGEELFSEIILSASPEESEKIVVYYPTEEKEGEYYQKKVSYDLSSFEYENPESYFDVDAMSYASYIETILEKESEPSTIYTESTKVLEIEEKLEQLDENVNLEPKFFITLLENFILSWCIGAGYSILISKNTSYRDQEGTKLSIKVDREKIKQLKKELKIIR